MAGADRLKPQGFKKQLQTASHRRRAANLAEVEAAAAAVTLRNDPQPAMATVMKAINELKPSPHRTRVTTPELKASLAKSIRQFGLLMPILIDAKDQVIAGHEVWEAARQLGLKQIECRVAEHLRPVECEAASLALNRIGELGRFDLDMLRERMIVIKSAGIELTSTGFSLPEIDQVLAVPRAVEAGDDDEGDEDEDAAVVSEIGDLFQLGDHRLLCGDALDLPLTNAYSTAAKPRVCSVIRHTAAASRTLSAVWANTNTRIL